MSTPPVAIVGASLGASLAVLAAADIPSVRGVVLVSPAADYRGVRLDGAVRKYGARAMLLIASSEDPYALRTVRGLVSDATSGREQRLSSVAAHGTILLDRDPDVASALVDWLRRTLS
jgi:pimeloyl-ACP methyl ester carboxylesterase